MPFHQVIWLVFFFLIRNNSRHFKQKPWPRRFHSQMRMKVRVVGWKSMGTGEERGMMTRGWMSRGWVSWRRGRWPHQPIVRNCWAHYCCTSSWTCCYCWRSYWGHSIRWWEWILSSLRLKKFLMNTYNCYGLRNGSILDHFIVPSTSL